MQHAVHSLIKFIFKSSVRNIAVHQLQNILNYQFIQGNRSTFILFKCTPIQTFNIDAEQSFASINVFGLLPSLNKNRKVTLISLH